MSDSVRPHRRQPTRLPHPWDSPGKNTGVGCHFFLQCMKMKKQSEVAQSWCQLSTAVVLGPWASPLFLTLTFEPSNPLVPLGILPKASNRRRLWCLSVFFIHNKGSHLVWVLFAKEITDAFSFLFQFTFLGFFFLFFTKNSI